MSVKAIVVIILQHTNVSNQHTVHLKLTQSYSQFYLNKGRGNKKEETAHLKFCIWPKGIFQIKAT